MRRIVHHTSYYSNVEGGGFLMEEGQSTEHFSCEPDSIDREDGITAVDLAARVLSEALYVEEVSSYPYQPRAWYSRSDDILGGYAPEGAEREEHSAHLEGFTSEEEWSIFAKVGLPN
jgi:hypothetical protein